MSYYVILSEAKDLFLDETLKYYATHANEYHELNKGRDLSFDYGLFLQHIPGPKILDFGCGTGCDARYFAALEKQITGVDGSAEMLAIAQAECPTGEFLCVDFKSDFTIKGMFDGIWASASLLHFTDAEFSKIMRTIVGNLSPRGVIFLSLKISDSAVGDDGRYFNFWTREKLRPFLDALGLRVLCHHESEYRTSRWLNSYLGQ